jgi:hypothetical protein
MALQLVPPPESVTTQNILLYGPGGSGKSVAACSAPGPVLVLNAEGPNALRMARAKYGAKVHEIEFTGARTLDEAFVHVRDGGGADPERTLVVDTLGEVYRVLVEEVGGDRPTLQQYGDINTKLARFVRSIRDLDINVVLLAHEQVDDAAGEITRRPATGGRKLPEQVVAQMDIVAYTGVILATETEPERYVGQVVEVNGRRAKDRSKSLGTFRDLDLSEWIATACRVMNAPATDDGKRAA